MTLSVLTAENFAEAISSSEITIVDFWADWCGPCKVLAPILDSLSDKYEGSLIISKINISDHPEIASKHNISSIPCLIVFRSGKEIDRSVGFKGHQALEELLSKHTSS